MTIDEVKCKIETVYFLGAFAFNLNLITFEINSIINEDQL